MKRKRPVPVQAAPQIAATVEPSVTAEKQCYDRLFVAFFTTTLFFAMTVQTKIAAVILACIAIVSLIGRGPLSNFRQRLSVPTLGLLLFALVGGCAGLYSNFGNYALKEYVKLLASFSLVIILLARGKKCHVRALLWGFVFICGIISLLSVDMDGSQILYAPFARLMELLGNGEYVTLLEKQATYARIRGIYNDANVTANIFALGTIVAVYLALDSKEFQKKLFAQILLGMSMMGFVLSLSRGGILCFALALICYLLVSGKEQRVPLFFLLLESAVIAVFLSAVSMPFIGTESALPIVLLVLCGLVIYGVDRGICSRLVERLEGHGRAIGASALVVVVLLISYGIAAILISGPYKIGNSGEVTRAVDLSAGTYSMEATAPPEVTVVVYTQSWQEELEFTSTTLYSGSIMDCQFILPEDETAHFRFIGTPGDVIEKVSLSDGTKVHMGYPLLPSFVADRIQDALGSSMSTWQRLQFFEDSMLLFLQSPIMGHGFGSTEALYTAVQPYFYESLYVHNHLLQVMDDMGLLGLVSFLMLLVGVGWVLLCQIKGNRNPLGAAFFTCWVMMNTHGLMEINFSIRAYQCAAFFLLALTIICFEKPFPEKVRKWGGAIAVFGTGAYLIVFSALLVCNILAAQLFASARNNVNITVPEMIDVLQKADTLDFYEDQQYKVNLMGNALQSGGNKNEGIAARCARELRETGDYDACYYVAAYYYLPLGQLDSFFNVLLEGLQQERSNPEAWNSAMNLCTQAYEIIEPEDMQDFVSGVIRIGEEMDRVNAELLIPITLSEENALFLSRIRTGELDT